MLTPGLMDRAHAPTITVIALIPDADSWSNGWLTCPNHYSDRLVARMLTSGLIDRAHAPIISDSSDVRRHPNLIKTLLSVQTIRL